jgi:sugar phosphate isomerase/epimerase
MPPKFSLAHLTVLGCAPPEMTHIAARAGYDFVSFRILMMKAATEHGCDYSLAENKVMLRETRAALAETGLRVHDIELARIFPGVDIQSYLPAFEVAAELGARHVMSSVWTPDRAFAAEAFAELCDLAKPLGLTVDLEFVTWADVSNLQQALDLLYAADCSNAGLLIDVLHFNRSRVALDELDRVPREWFHFVHLCDAPAEIPATREGLIHAGREERLYVGEGGIDVGAILARLPEVLYSIEIPHLARVKEIGYQEHANRCLQTAKAYFASRSSNSLAAPAR